MSLGQENLCFFFQVAFQDDWLLKKRNCLSFQDIVSMTSLSFEGEKIAESLFFVLVIFSASSPVGPLAPAEERTKCKVMAIKSERSFDSKPTKPFLYWWVVAIRLPQATNGSISPNPQRVCHNQFQPTKLHSTLPVLTTRSYTQLTLYNLSFKPES